MQVALHEIVGEVATEHAPSIWSRLPAALKAEIVDRAMEQVPVFARGMLTEVRTVRLRTAFLWLIPFRLL